MERFENLPNDPSTAAQAELEQRLMERELDFDVVREIDGSFSISIKNDERMDVQHIMEELAAERLYGGDTHYPWLDDVLVSGDKENVVMYYNPN